MHLLEEDYMKPSLEYTTPGSLHLAPARYFHISYVQYLAVMSSKFIISLSQSANQINGYGFSTFLPMRRSFT